MRQSATIATILLVRHRGSLAQSTRNTTVVLALLLAENPGLNLRKGSLQTGQLNRPGLHRVSMKSGAVQLESTILGRG